MTLEKNIKEKYNKRGKKDQLYSGVYTDFCEAERVPKTKYLTDKFLKDYSDKTILEIGAGHGSNTYMFLQFGFSKENIFLNELLPDRIENIKRNFKGIKLYEGNALDVTFDNTFDCVYQSTVFSSILNDDDRKELARKMWELLKPGGIILWYDFIYNNPWNKDVRKISVKELKNLFPKANKKEILKVTLAPPIGRRVGKFYPLFNVPFLRSHILAIFQKA